MKDDISQPKITPIGLYQCFFVLSSVVFQCLDLSQRVKKNIVGAPSGISTSQSMSSCVDLPEDIVVKILCRLPVKSLIRFCCVSKRWLSIISDPKFRESHFQLASQLRTITRKFLLISYSSVTVLGLTSNATYDPTSKLPPRFQSLDDNFSVKTFTFPPEEREQMRILGSCNGLLLLGQYCCENLCVRNLSTGFFRRISNPCLRGRSMYSTVGFGYVSASDDYKLVFIVPALGDLLEVHIFSLRANIWRVITAPYSSWPGWKSGQGTFFNGAIHWVIGRRNETSDPVIYAFDLAKEEFRKVILPPVLWQNGEGNHLMPVLWQNGEGDHPTHMLPAITNVVHLGGYLCICSWKPYDLRHEVWAMKVYGMPESWVKLFQFDIHDILNVFAYPTWKLCFITESGTMVIKTYEELLWIECRNDERPICTSRYKLEEVELPGCSFHFDAIAYDETLVSVAE